MNTATVRGRQLIFVLFITRTLYSTCFIPAVAPGVSIQDVLPAVPVVFLINLLLSVPMLALLRRHPGRDFIECSVQSVGRVGGYLLCFLVYAYVLLIASATLGTSNVFYVSLINSDLSVLLLIVGMLVVAVYGAVKGIETLARFALFVMVIYLVIFLFISFTLVPTFRFDNLMPMFYNGPRVFVQTVTAGVDQSFQLMLLAMCTPFLSKKNSLVKNYVLWDVFSMAVWAVSLVLVVLTLGPYGSKQIFPLGTMVTYSHIATFERLDSFDMLAWLLETVLSIGFYLFVLSQCLMRVGLRRWRRSCIAASAALIGLLAYFGTNQYSRLLVLYRLPAVALATVGMLFLLPLIVLLCDVVGEKVRANAQARS